ncbi:FliI/YscN family ATPase [uncultured Tateyamaria sp.]|uniref:FliI/YscN family ATPase n=1 Tax=uncultured Tateyamaria sp. TaxID=455651 RepID=UPI002629B735|nr:FliI/YscN family ATPase [uncultured Tateyamaria sp.]
MQDTRLQYKIKTSNRITSAVGPVVRASGNFRIGDICEIDVGDGQHILSEVIGFDDGGALLTPYGALTGVSSLSPIRNVSGGFMVPVGDPLLGRVLDGQGQPIDGHGSFGSTQYFPSDNEPPSAMTRPLIADIFSTGVRAIDGLLTCAVGQRIGIFAAAGGGKTTLLSMMIRFAECDRVVVALIGERGREVREFVEESLGSAGMARSVVVVATSDRPSVEQVQAAYTATAIAEAFREEGHKVLLMVDSLTRFARAQRQIGLSAGEPPTRRGFPPSVFSKLPKLVERSGNSDNGSITAFYTVLMEGDDMNEPVADETRSLLDGHIILSREVAKSGRYPAIDILASASRVMNQVVTREHQDEAIHFKELYDAYAENELLIKIGEYQSGGDPIVDKAISLREQMLAFLKQRVDEPNPIEDTLSALNEMVGG